MNIDLDFLPPKTKNLLEKIAKKRFIKKFYLAGGSAVALFLNHRQSDDLDFFSDKEFSSPVLIKNLKGIGEFRGAKSAENTIIGKLEGIKISFFTLPYGLLEPSIKYKNLSIAQPLDLAAMKILAVSDRGTKRDFIDLYFLCQRLRPLDELLYFFQKKFGKYDYNIYHIIKSIAYFEEAENDPIPKMYLEVEWGIVKKFFEQEKPKLAKKFLRL